MTFPVDWNLVTVRMEYVGTDGTPISGKVIFTPRSSRFIDSEQNTTLIGRSASAVLDASGIATIALPATDDPDVNPTNFTYEVKEDFIGGMTYDIQLPLALAPTGVDLSGISPVGTVNGTVMTRGEAGPPPNLTIGTVTTVPLGDPAGATITGTTPDYQLNLDLPSGPAGPANSLAIGTVSEGAEGTPAAASVTGTAPAQTLNLTLPRGVTGTPGPPGPLGYSINTTATGGTYTLNPAWATDYTLLLTGNVSLVATSMSPGQSIYVALLQDGVGGRTVTLPATWIGRDDVVFNVDPNKFDVLVVWKTWLGIHVKRVQTGASTLWTPQAMTNQVAWFNADSLSLDPNDTVTVWDNQWAEVDLPKASGTPSLQLVNGTKYVKLTGANSDYFEADLTGTYAQPMTWGMVVKINGSGTQPIIDAVGLLEAEIFVSGSPQHWWLNGMEATTLSVPSGTWVTFVGVMNGGTSKIRVNGVEETGNAGSKNITTLRLGTNQAAGAFATIDVAELLVVSHASDGAEVANLETYLNTKRDQLAGV